MSLADVCACVCLSNVKGISESTLGSNKYLLAFLVCFKRMETKTVSTERVYSKRITNIDSMPLAVACDVFGWERVGFDVKYYAHTDLEKRSTYMFICRHRQFHLFLLVSVASSYVRDAL